MLNVHARGLFTRLLTPLARALMRAGVSPDVVTVVGTTGVCAGALVFYPKGHFFVGTLVITAFVFSDLVDGTMARMSGRTSRWGAFLDSTLDRVGDGAVFGSLVLWFAGAGDDLVLAAVTLAALVGGTVTSYAKARAEGLGMTADVGLVERAERLVTVLVATGLDGLGVPYVQAIALWGLALAGVVTVMQRMVEVRRQSALAAPRHDVVPPTDPGP